MPPDDPDPREIRKSADEDAREGRYEIAAEKYRWYHENALIYRPALAGVRLSFALHDWRSLANQYPPALQDMRLARDTAEQSLKREEGGFSAFQDFVALNDVLDDDGRTIQLFRWLDEHDRHLARDVFFAAQDVLADNGEYALCERYIVGQNSFDALLESYERTLEIFAERYEGEDADATLDAVHMVFARRAALIVAVLVNRDRPSEAQAIADRALQALASDKYAVQISDALEGIPPKRFRL